jgi:hypothetical protein
MPNAIPNRLEHGAINVATGVTPSFRNRLPERTGFAVRTTKRVG